QPVPVAPEPVLPPRRGRGRPRRHEHRPVHRAPAQLRRRGAVHRRDAPEAHDGGRRRALRRHDGDRGRLADRVAPLASGLAGRCDRLGSPGRSMPVDKGGDMAKVLVNLTTGMEDAEKVTLAFLVATAALEQGNEVVIWTTKEAVRLGLPGTA